MILLIVKSKFLLLTLFCLTDCHASAILRMPLTLAKDHIFDKLICLLKMIIKCLIISIYTHFYTNRFRMIPKKHIRFTKY